jgi:hypothetical protein
MLSVSHKLKRLGALLLLSGPLASCAFFHGADVEAIYAIGKQAIAPNRVTLEQAAATPYASIGVRLGGSSEIMLVLATDASAEQLWTSASRIAIATSAGRVVRTSGLEHNLSNLVLLERKSGDNGGATVRWLADWPDLNAISVPVVCESRPVGDETITILGKPIHTQRVNENCRAEARKFIWTFENVYWIDPDSGLVWRSIQNISPKLDELKLEILRPPA